MVTLWPRFWRPTAASMTRRSAPPMPRSGWKKTMFWRLADIVAAMVLQEGYVVHAYADLKLATGKVLYGSGLVDCHSGDSARAVSTTRQVYDDLESPALISISFAIAALWNLR